MKDKIKGFIIEKKELLIFIGIVLFVFTGVIGIANLAVNTNNNEEPPVVSEPSEPSTSVDEPSEPIVTVADKFSLPLIGEYKVVRQYFDSELYTKEELEACVIPSQNGFVTSTGVSYSNLDNTEFDVIAIYDGTVSSVIIDDELVGCSVVIDHGNGIKSIYSSLADVIVQAGDIISLGDKIASSATSINDSDALIHVSLQIEIDGEYVNPNTIIGSEIDEITDMK